SYRESRALDCAADAELWDPSLDPDVDRRREGGEYWAEPALRRCALGRATCGDRAGPAEHGGAPANFDGPHDQGGPGVHLYRNVGFGPSSAATVYFLYADSARPVGGRFIS